MSAAPIIIQGNMPMDGNSSHVETWNNTSMAYAGSRVLRQSSHPTIVRSNRVPAQLMAYGTHASRRNGARTGVPVAL